MTTKGGFRICDGQYECVQKCCEMLHHSRHSKSLTMCMYNPEQTLIHLISHLLCDYHKKVKDFLVCPKAVL